MEHYLNQAPCLYFSVSEEGTIIDVNQTLCTQLGYTQEELLGKKPEVIFTLSTRIFYQTHFYPLLKIQGYAEEIYITLQTKNFEHVPILINAEIKIINDKPTMVHVGIVVHNRKKFEDELIAAKKAAETALQENTELIKTKQQLQQHLEKLDLQMSLINKQNKELTQFNRVVTHDVQEPLRKLSVFANLILENKEIDKLETIVEKFSRALNQMRVIISGLQQYVWLTGNFNKKHRINLNNVIKVIKQQLHEEFAGVDMNIHAPDLPYIRGDKEQIQLLFYHLLSNSIRFRKPGNAADVTITSTNITLNKFKNIEDKYKYEDFLKLEIADKGIGFDSAYKQKVFELFKRLHTQTTARGIGLALCKKIIENHHGDITIDAKEGHGTTVTILLPQNETDDAKP